MKYILGTKIRMTQIFSDKGAVIPVTIVKSGACVVTQVKTKSKDGYSAIQVGFGKKKRLTKQLVGHCKGLGSFLYFREFREVNTPVQVGETISIDSFVQGDKVKVTGFSKGKGFQGVVKRHGFAGGPGSHGVKDQLRMPGSIGAKGPAHVFKGMRMGGRTGFDQVTISNLEIIQVDREEGLLYIKGAVPGARNSLLIISGEGSIIVNPMKIKNEEIQKEVVDAGVSKSINDNQSAPDVLTT